MDQQLHQIAEKVNKQHRRKIWQRIVSVMGCLVMFCTTYALILPAITMEKDVFCGLDAHEHDETCFNTGSSLVCTLAESEGHTHNDDCYILQGGHIHAEGCYEHLTGDLICTVEEVAGHTHDAACYTDVLICTEEGDHIHESTCYQQQLLCQIPETQGHTHDQACYQQMTSLICPLEETPGELLLSCTLAETEAHIHTEACYAPVEEPVLICQIEPHTHTLACHSDPNADLEDAAMWESSFSHVEKKSIWAEDLLAIADSQIGYRESIDNYLVDEDGETTKGYTRYGAWYGDHYGDWCAMFVSFCLNYADIPQEAIPYEASCPRWVTALQAPEWNLYRSARTYTPVPGDVIFFDWEGDDSSDHVGIVAELIPATDDQPATVKTIEGNSADTVRYVTYELADPAIMGYGKLPASLHDKSLMLTEQVLNAGIYTDATYTTPAEDATVITVSGMLPQGAVARAYPVELAEDTIDGQLVVLAYDITIFDAEGNLFEQAAPENPLTVSIRPADWTESETVDPDAGYNAYYIPEEGEPEAIDTTTGDDAVSFQTDHFSTYALTVSGTMSTVYLNGASGNDSRAGNSANTAVKTLEKALALAKDGATIYITGTVTVSEPTELTMSGTSKVTIRRNTNFTGPLITVANGGELILGQGVTIHGGSGTPSASDIATNSTYATGSAKAPLIVVNSGCRLNILDGAVLEYNSNQPDSSSNKFVENGYVGLGGAVYCNGTLTMNGGLIQYCEAQCGGGVYVENGSFYLNGGTIDHNYARDIVSYKNRVGNYHKNAGGGVYVGDNAIMTMTGGLISNNQSSREGGGISLGWLNRSNNAGIDSYITTFTMNGGTLDHNYAVSTGGGLNITAGRQAFINAGYITYNKADGKEYQDSSSWVSAGKSVNVFSGGGIYIDAAQWSNYAQEKHDGVPGKAVINRVMVTSNTASYGGGLASCGTSINFLYGDATNGTAIYGNTANSSSNSKEMYVENGQLSNSNTVLGGGSYGWSIRSVYYGTGYTNSLTSTSSAIVKAKELATVFITNNTAYLGGGIGCNGLIEIGGEKEESTYINIQKIWEDDGTVAHPEYIEVQILQDGKPYGEPIRIYRSYDANGNEIWPTFYVGGLPSGHTYTIQEIEVPGYMATIEQKGQDFIITNKPKNYQVTKKWVDESGDAITEDLPGFIEVQLYQNGQPYGDPVILNAENGWSYEWPNLPKKDSNGNDYIYTTQELHVPDGFYTTTDGFGESDDPLAPVITNIRSERTSISVEKQWADGTPITDVTVQLLQNGEPYRDPVTLNEANNWFYKWENLPVKDTSGNDVTYTVTELNADGFDVTVTDGVRSEIPKIWTATSTLENGNTYLLVSENGALAADSSGLSWTSVAENLANGTSPSNAALWTHSNGTLRSGSGSYLAYSDKTYRTGTSGTSLTISNGIISYSTGFIFKTTYYFGNSITNGTANAPTSDSEAAVFTFYKQVDGDDPCAHWGDKHYVVTNTAKKAIDLEVKFAKYSTGTDTAGNPTLLAGAELELYKADDTAADLIPGTEVTGTLVTAWTSEAGSNDNPEGIRAENLLSGTYYLVETKAPDGHAGLSGPIVFEVDAESGTVTVTEYPDRPALEGTVDGVLPIYNAVMVMLPETGGIGTTPYTFGGLLLIAAAGILLLYNQRKRGRENATSS